MRRSTPPFTALLSTTFIALLVAASTASGQAWRVGHVAGAPAGGAGSADGLGTNAQFSSPSGVAVDAGGVLYIADRDNHTIRKVFPDGTVATLAGAAGQVGTDDGVGPAARFTYPTGVAVDGGGTLYVADYENHTIRKVLPDGTVTTFAGAALTPGSANGVGGAARFYYPRATAVDASGNVYVADEGNDTIRKILPDGTVSTLAGLAGSFGSADGVGSAARFDRPAGVAVDASGTVYVADSFNSTIRRVAANGTVTTLAGAAGQFDHVDGVGADARFMTPIAVALTSSGSIAVADYDGHVIRLVATDATVTTLAGQPAVPGSADGLVADASFFGPQGVAGGAADAVYVADTNNHTVRLVAAGEVTTIAGAPPLAGYADGAGPAARFNIPSGVAVDGARTVYLADGFNHAIRTITAGGGVGTLAGTPGVPGGLDGIGGAALFNTPGGVAVDAAGVVFVADTFNYAIRKILPDATVTTLAGSLGVWGSEDGVGSAARFWQPVGLAVDGFGTLYVTEGDGNTIRKVLADGTVTTLAGTAGVAGSADGVGAAASFFFPAGIALAPDGSLYVADLGNHTIRRVLPDGTVSTVAGTAGVPGATDGPAASALFDQPSGIAVDAAGVVYVSEIGNHQVRMIAVDGTVSTIAGTAGLAGHTDGMVGARFNQPLGIAVLDPVRLVVADAMNHAIRSVDRVTGARPSTDRDRDARADIAVYRPASGTWFWLKSGAANADFDFKGWGVQADGDTPIIGDFDGDGVLDPAVFRPAAGTWFVLESRLGYTTWDFFGWGATGDVLVPGDYDGDGTTDAAIYRAGTWFVRTSGPTTDWSVLFGQPGDLPIAGDFDGDGKRDPAVYRPSTGSWFWLESSTGLTTFGLQGWGMQSQGDTPAPGDYDGDGKTDMCVFRPAAGTWFILESRANYTTWNYFGWGLAGDTLAPADYDNDGVTDAAIYRPTTGDWFVRLANGATQWNVVFGAPTDVPLVTIK